MADIAINPVTRRVQFTGNTGTGPFAFTFNILTDADIAVYKNTTLLSLTSHYTIATNANGTGSVTLQSGQALISSDVLTIIGGRNLERTTDFVTAGDLLASSLNEQLDSLVIMTQQLDEKLTRSVKVNPGDVFTDLEMPLKDARKGTVLGFNATTGDPEPGPTIADVSTLTAITADISTLADIEDGTDATDAIQTVAGISSNVSTVAGVSSAVSTVAGISSNVTAVAGDATDIGVVAGKAAEIGRLGTAQAVADLDILATTDAVSDMNTLAAISSNISTVAGISANVTSVAGVASLITSDFVADLNTLATTDIVSDLNTLATADIVSDLNTLATSDIVSDLNTLATADIVSDLNTLATTDIVSDLNTLATTDIVTDLNLLATSAIVEDLNLLATSTVIADMATLAGAGANPNISSLGVSGTVTAGGLTVDGAASITTGDNTAQLTLISTDADANDGPLLVLNRNSSSPVDNDKVGQIQFLGEDDASNSTIFGSIVNQIKDASNGSEDGRMSFNLISAGSDRTFFNLTHDGTQAEVVVNEDSQDIDFRVESDGNTHMLFVDAGADHVNIGTGSDRGGVLNVYGTGTPIAVIESEADGTVLSLRTTDSDANAGPNLELYRNATGTAGDNLGSILIKGTDASAQDQVYFSIGTQISAAGNGVEASTVFIKNAQGGALRERITIGTSAIVINQEGLDTDFRVESDNNSGMLVVDAAADQVRMGNASASTPSSVASLVARTGVTTDYSGSLTMSYQAGTYTDYYKGMTGINPSTSGARGLHIFNHDNDSDGGISFWSGRPTVGTPVLMAQFGPNNVIFNDNSADRDFRVESNNNVNALFLDAGSDRVCIGNNDGNVQGFSFQNLHVASNYAWFGHNASNTNEPILYINRQNNDGSLVKFYQATSEEGSISVSGSTVSFNGFSGRHESSGIPTNTAKGTVVSTIDALDVYPNTQLDPKTGEPQANPKAGQTRADHAKVEISSSEGDTCVYGVVSEFDSNGKVIVTSVGIGSVRVTGACSKGDLLESNGDGTAKVQSDDIVRSKTLGKVTIGNSDTGVKLVSCVMYCG